MNYLYKNNKVYVLNTDETGMYLTHVMKVFIKLDCKVPFINLVDDGEPSEKHLDELMKLP